MHPGIILTNLVRNYHSDVLIPHHPLSSRRSRTYFCIPSSCHQTAHNTLPALGGE